MGPSAWRRVGEQRRRDRLVKLGVVSSLVRKRCLVAEQSEGVWWCGTGPAQQLPGFVASQPPLRRLVIANVPQLYSELQNRADKLGFDLSAGDLFLAPDDPLFISWVTEFREQREALQRKFDPLHGGRAPPRPSAQQRKALEVLACGVHSH